MKKSQITPTVVLLFSLIVLPILYIVLFSAQAINSLNANQPETPLNGYMSREECVKAELQGCEMVVSTDGHELWVIIE